MERGLHAKQRSHHDTTFACQHRRVVPDGGEDKKGGVFNSEAPVYYSQVQLVDPSDG